MLITYDDDNRGIRISTGGTALCERMVYASVCVFGRLAYYGADSIAMLAVGAPLTIARLPDCYQT